MRVVVVGAGPVGLFCGMALARRGEEVTVVDRDAGPGAAGPWERRGVMQFHHPHFFRSIVRGVLLETVPEVWEAAVAAGGVPVRLDGFPEDMTSLACRRSTFERAAWAVAVREPRLRLLAGHAERVVSERGRVTGLVVDGSTVEADLVIVATGRAGRVADEVRPPAEGGACGFSYVSRMYRARPGVEPPVFPTPVGSLYHGYQAIVFPQDDATLSTLIVRTSADTDLAELRHNDCFDAVAPLIPQIAPWVDPDRFDPITDVMPGGGLTNTYRRQIADDGRAPLPGLLFVGDAVSTTNPIAGRGVSLGLQQAAAVVAMLTEPGADAADVAVRFDSWCEEHIRPWYDDHVYWDETLLRRHAGEDIDVEARIASDVICAAAEVDPSMMPHAGPFMAMLAGPSTLAQVEEKARAVLRTGWRPPWSDGPTRDDLVGVLRTRAPGRGGAETRDGQFASA